MLDIKFYPKLIAGIQDEIGRIPKSKRLGLHYSNSHERLQHQTEGAYSFQDIKNQQEILRAQGAKSGMREGYEAAPSRKR